MRKKRKKKTCKQCGQPLVFRPYFKHARTGKTIWARTFGKRAFPFCACKR